MTFRSALVTLCILPVAVACLRGGRGAPETPPEEASAETQTVGIKGQAAEPSHPPVKSPVEANACVSPHVRAENQPKKIQVDEGCFAAKCRSVPTVLQQDTDLYTDAQTKRVIEKIKKGTRIHVSQIVTRTLPIRVRIMKQEKNDVESPPAGEELEISGIHEQAEDSDSITVGRATWWELANGQGTVQLTWCEIPQREYWVKARIANTKTTGWISGRGNFEAKLFRDYYTTE